MTSVKSFVVYIHIHIVAPRPNSLSNTHTHTHIHSPALKLGGASTEVNSGFVFELANDAY